MPQMGALFWLFLMFFFFFCFLFFLVLMYFSFFSGRLTYFCHKLSNFSLKF